ncbi:hypothetical protein GTGU_00158 [Trabulsiella guamensis ATCC 49490]|uniref:Uncharacterized protein n=1 Tax=Trabulsiella guamensis ATCC 49490 TaxID=1005994 RepID=A0A085ASE1_9ENTR|nr:hypothetical protein [Trabulsiella guamensis]KFC13136.1 hypothetical protein GTGU_00158 [Trabulsiella guamensis ATCC 49490]
MRIIAIIIALLLSPLSQALGLKMTTQQFIDRYSNEVTKSNLSDDIKNELTDIEFSPPVDEKNWQFAKTGDVILAVADVDSDGDLDIVGVDYSSSANLPGGVYVARAALLNATIGPELSQSRDVDYVKSIPGVRRDMKRSKIVKGFKVTNLRSSENSMLLSVQNVSNKNPDKARGNK